MQYISTKGNVPPVSAAKAIKQGMVPHGGLYVPEKIPEVDIMDMDFRNYSELAEYLLSLFLTDYSEVEIRSAVQSAYKSGRFDHPDIAPLHVLEEGLAVLELWHGPTAAFKDMALQIMPRLLTTAAHKIGDENEIVILVATSGDTGKAALEGFKNVSGTRIIVFYPAKGVSPIQQLQMTTTDGNNTEVVAVEGNFDDCQNLVKELFIDSQLRKELAEHQMELSSANSINWGRLLPQIIYYFWAYMQMAEKKEIMIGDEINIVVPTGNFGNILSAYYAEKMGLPVNRLICASNKNKILTDFIKTGVYDTRREFYRTSSPSMDILISSNLERFLFEITRHNAEKINRWYGDLKNKKMFKVDESTRLRLSETIIAGYAEEKETFDEIKRVFEKYAYLLDTHSAVGSLVYRRYREESEDSTPTILDATASPFKFNRAVYRALGENDQNMDEFEILKALSIKSAMPVHEALRGLDKKQVKHRTTVSLKNARAVLEKTLGFVDK